VFKKEKLVLKLDKNAPKGEKEKKSARNQPKAASSKASKPVSAREKKASKHRFIEELKEKYENQTILEEQLGSSRFKEEENMDHEFLSVMSSLEKILSSVGSKHKLKKELDMINEKLREFKLETEED
jgi:very-short-patch-repair endonuclease